MRKNLIRQTMIALILILIPVIIYAGTKQIPQRSEIDDKYKWDLSVLYPDLDAWEKDYKFIELNIDRFGQYKG